MIVFCRKPIRRAISKMSEREARLRRRVGGDRMECEGEEEEDAGLVRDGDALPSSSGATAAAARLAASATVAAVAAGEPPEWLSSAMALLAPRLESLAAFCEGAYGVAAPFARAAAAIGPSPTRRRAGKWCCAHANNG